MSAEVFKWVTADGLAFDLSTGIDGIRVLQSVTGRFMPPIRSTEEIVPLQPGQRQRSIVHDQSAVTLAVRFTGGDLAGLRSVVRAWLARLDPTRGDGKLQVVDPFGATRELSCAYQDGLEFDENATTRTPYGEQLAVITFTANDPYWADITDTVDSFTAGTPPTFFPFFPLVLGASQIFGMTTVTNVGDVATYPVWTITGPGTDVVLQNATSGRTLEWAGTLGIGETLTLDARGGNQSPAPKSVVKNDGSNQFGLLAQFDFWPFVPGDNTLNISMNAATGASVVSVAYRARYLGA